MWVHIEPTAHVEPHTIEQWHWRRPEGSVCAIQRDIDDRWVLMIKAQDGSLLMTTYPSTLTICEMKDHAHVELRRRGWST